MKRVINDYHKLIHVDNPSSDITENQRRVSLNKEEREYSRKILLAHLTTCQDVYCPSNLDSLNERGSSAVVPCWNRFYQN
jgi:hypothetical protein